MSKKKYIVDLMEEEKERLRQLIKGGKNSARKIRRAHILLLAEEDRTDESIGEALHVSMPTVQRTRKRFVEGGLEWALNERPRPGQRPKMNGKQEAFLIALACSAPPKGRKRWTMELLADQLVDLGMIDSISDETVRRLLKKRSQTLAEGRVVHP